MFDTARINTGKIGYVSYQCKNLLFAGKAIFIQCLKSRACIVYISYISNHICNVVCTNLEVIKVLRI